MKPLSLTRAALEPLQAQVLADDVFDLAGEYSQYTVPRPVGEAIMHAADTTDLARNTTAGGRHLVSRIRHKLDEINDLETTDDSIVITSGGTAGLAFAFGALADAGETILVPDPGWPGYARLCGSWGIEPVAYPLLPDGRPDYDGVEDLIRHDTKALVISQPSNPWGAVLGAEDLQELVDFARLHDLYLISDETYDMIRFEPGPALGPARFDTDGRVITIYSFAKTHALAGLRLGYCVAAPPLARAIAGAQDSQLSGASTLALAAGQAALDMSDAVCDSMLRYYHQQREIALAMLPPAAVPRPPEGTYFLVVDVSRTQVPDGERFAALLYQRHQVIVAPGPRFGPRANGLLRVTLAVREKPFAEAIDRLGDLWEELSP